MHTPYDDLVDTIRAGLGRCQRRWFRELSMALDPDGVTLAERVIAQIIIEELNAARYQVRRPSSPASLMRSGSQEVGNATTVHFSLSLSSRT